MSGELHQGSCTGRTVPGELHTDVAGGRVLVLVLVVMVVVRMLRFAEVTDI